MVYAAAIAGLIVVFVVLAPFLPGTSDSSGDAGKTPEARAHSGQRPVVIGLQEVDAERVQLQLGATPIEAYTAISELVSRGVEVQLVPASQSAGYVLVVCKRADARRVKAQVAHAMAVMPQRSLAGAAS